MVVNNGPLVSWYNLNIVIVINSFSTVYFKKDMGEWWALSLLLWPVSLQVERAPLAYAWVAYGVRISTLVNVTIVRHIYRTLSTKDVRHVGQLSIRGSQPLKTRSHIRPFFTRGPDYMWWNLLKVLDSLLTMLPCRSCVRLGWESVLCCRGCQHFTSIFTFKMEVMHSSEALVSTYKTMRRHISEDSNRHFSPSWDPQIWKMLSQTDSHTFSIIFFVVFLCLFELIIH